MRSARFDRPRAANDARDPGVVVRPYPHLGEKYGITVAQVVEVYGVAADGISWILRHA